MCDEVVERRYEAWVRMHEAKTVRSEGFLPRIPVASQHNRCSYGKPMHDCTVKRDAEHRNWNFRLGRRTIFRMIHTANEHVGHSHLFLVLGS